MGSFVILYIIWWGGDGRSPRSGGTDRQFQIRLAKDLQCHNVESYGFAAKAIDEIGRLVGGSSFESRTVMEEEVVWNAKDGLPKSVLCNGLPSVSIVSPVTNGVDNLLLVFVGNRRTAGPTSKRICTRSSLVRLRSGLERKPSLDSGGW